MIFLPFTAPFMLPLLGAYNSIDTIDNMAQLREKGNLTTVEAVKGVAEIGMNFLPYLGELKPVASAGKIALYTLDGFTIGGQAVIMTSEAVSQMRRIRDADVQKVADKEAEIKELERTNPSSPDLDRLRQEEKDLMEQTRTDAEAQINNLAGSFAIMGMQVAGMHALSAHVSARNIKSAETEGIFLHHEGVEPHYDPTTAEIKGDRAKLDSGKLAQLQKQYEVDMASKQTELKNILGSDKIEVVRTNEAKPKIVKDGDGYKVEVPKNKPFQSAIDEALRFQRANGNPKPTPRATPERELTPDQQKLVTKNVAAKQPGAMLGDTVDKAYLTDEQLDIERWQTHALNDEATDVSSKNHAMVNKMATNPEFRHWYDVWMSMPDRITVEPDGHSKVNVPSGCPTDIAEGIKAIGEKGNVGLMTRALDVSKRIEAEFPGLNPDPSSTAWKQARPKLVEMLGEAEVKKYETEQGGLQTEGQRQVMHDRLDQLLAPGELAHITELVPGAKVYVTGSAAQTNKAVASVTDLDLIIVVPRETPQPQRVELEQRVQGMKVHRPAQGSTPGAEMAVDCKVMTDDQFMGLSMSKTAEGRTPLSNFRVDEPTGGTVPGTGASGGDLHNHVMGVPATQYFVDKVGGGSATVTLEKLFKDVHELELAHQQNPQQNKPPVTADVSAQIKQGHAEVENAKAAGMAPDVVEARARRTLDNVLAANDRTPFDATYDVRDLLVSKHIDKGSKGFENFAKDVITDLHDQGVTYSEQSVSQKKLETKFTPEAMKAAHDKAAAEGKDSELKFLVMAPTSETLSAKAKPSPEAVKAADAKLEKSLMRPDVNGMDVAGPEAQPFTKAGMDWFVDRYKMLDRVAKQKGERMVLRPHVGEGYDPAGTGEHVKIAQDNLRMLVKTLKDLGYNGSGDVIVRLGHATHATPEILQDMAATGIIVEANVGSNLATGSVLTAEQHPLLQNMFYGVKTILATDGQGVMGTTLPAEYQRAGLLIDRFKSGTPLEIDGKQVTYNSLDAATQKRFSIEWLQQQLANYRADQSTPPGTPSAPPSKP
jgi:adenosine deaminase